MNISSRDNASLTPYVRSALSLGLACLLFASAVAREGGRSPQQEGGTRAAQAGRDEQKKGRATVRGRVVYGDTGKPLRRAVVTLLTNLNHPALVRTLTDGRGEFRFRGVPAGTYLVAADAPGVISRSSGFSIQDTGFGLEGVEKSLGRVTVGDDGEAKVELSVERGGSISGRVAYSDGEPVTAAYLLLYRLKGVEPTRFFTDPARTDDRGAYRFEGLPPGDYVVGVVEKGAGGDKLLPRTEGTGLASRYHPSAASARDAATVHVEAGGEAEGVDIRLAENELRRLSGLVRWRRTGEPARKAVVMLRRRDDPAVVASVADFLRNITPSGADRDDTMLRDMALFGMMSSNAPYVETDLEGRWSFEDVPPGVYFLTVIASLPAEKTNRPADRQDKYAEDDTETSDPDRPQVQRQVLVMLGSGDINDQRIELTEGGRVSGTVTADGGATPPFGVKISAATPGVGIESLFGSQGFMKPDGTFLIEGVTPGEPYLEAKLPPGRRYYVRSITANGTDLMREPLRVVDGGEVAGVRIDLGSDLAQVSGRVLNSDDRTLVAGAGLLLVAADEGLWHTQASRVFGRADVAGEFSVEAAPGDYLLFAWRPGEEPQGSVEDYARSHAASALRVSLKPGANSRLDLLATPPAQGEKRR